MTVGVGFPEMWSWRLQLAGLPVKESSLVEKR